MQTTGNIIKSFKSELNELYPPGEIKAITELVFEHFLGYSNTDLILKLDNTLNNNEVKSIYSTLHRLKDFEPIQYIIGQCQFYNCIFKVNHNVLIPRPETEELLEWIIKDHNHSERIRILDIGTGSGCIAVALAVSLKKALISACDISEKALNIASQNAEKNKARVSFFKLDILNPPNYSKESFEFEIIVSNPPYVMKKEKALMQKNVLDFEPELALFVDDDDPLLFYKAIINYAHLHLKAPGNLYLEINEKFGREITDLLESSGYIKIEVKKDINGKSRMVKGEKA